MYGYIVSYDKGGKSWFLRTDEGIVSYPNENDAQKHCDILNKEETDEEN